MHIDFEDQTNTVSKDHINLLRDIIMFTAKRENIPANTEISIVIVDNKVIQRMNAEYREIDHQTDVLSFPLQDFSVEQPNFEDETIPFALGDIVISIEQAKIQAKEYEHSLERELGFLIVHGFLHLLGYDHLTSAEEKIMFQKQKEILEEFRLER